MKTRINPKTGREEYWNQPEGLPGIWMERGFVNAVSHLINVWDFWI